MKIIRIQKNDDIFKRIVDYYYEWWGMKYYSYDDFKRMYESFLDNDVIPNVYALIDDSKLIGMYEINVHDMIDVAFEPFLANVFVLEEYRGHGYSKILINDAINEVKMMGYEYLYLRSKHENLYEKYGFELIEEIETNLGKKRIFRKSLSN